MTALRASQRFCGQMARREAKNFYWGFISLPANQRVAIYALYDFARQVDDEADATADAIARSLNAPDASALASLPERLMRHRERIHACYRGEYHDPVTHVLTRAIRDYKIPESELQELIDGVETDFYRTRYENWDQLRSYCRLVASVVGRMCVRIFGHSDDAALQHADELGLAFQLTNILRDVREDAERDRIYLPADELRRFGVAEADLLAGLPGPGWPALVALEVERARGLYASGLRVLDYIPRRAAVCVRTMAGIYERILHKIENDPWLPLRSRAALTRVEKLHVVVTSWLQAG